jgi:adenosylmethionine-8-amino-7-oxononanoate aminotransferase
VNVERTTSDGHGEVEVAGDGIDRVATDASPRRTAAAPWAAWDHAHLWHPFTPQAPWLSEEPLVIERALGTYLFDTSGRRFIDGVSSLWCNVHGHRHPALDQAIRAQLDQVAHTTLLGLSHPAAIELARGLVERAPAGLNRVFFSDSGATAVEVALKMAFQYWRQKPEPEPQRTRFVALQQAYHGDTLGDVSLGGVDAFHAMFRPLLFPTLRAPVPHCYRCPLALRRPECAMACLGEVDRLLTEHPGEVAAVVVEPLVQGAAGMIVHPEGYLAGLRELTRRHDTLLIADEVAVGFGRTGRLFACEHESVSPDFLCVAKGITGGYLPLAATLTTDRVHDAFLGDAHDDKTFFHGHTYGGNPLAAAVGLANLEVFQSERTIENLPDRIDRMAGWLDRFRRHRHVGEARQKGLMVGIELVADRETAQPFPRAENMGARVCRRARAHGVVIRPLGDVVVVMPPLNIAPATLDDLMNGILRSLEEVTGCPLA